MDLVYLMITTVIIVTFRYRNTFLCQVMAFGQYNLTGHYVLYVYTFNTYLSIYMYMCLQLTPYNCQNQAFIIREKDLLI